MSDQADFVAALMDPTRPHPATARNPQGGAAGRRFDVYRNNVATALIDALRAAFPAIDKLVGADFFGAMAGEFMRAHPPRSPVISEYGDAFPDWLAAFPPVAQLPYLPEVARIEQARRIAYHAADAAPLDPAALAGTAPEALALMQLRPHPSAHWMTTTHPALAIWARNADRPDLADTPAGEVLICRPALEVLTVPAATGSCATLNALRDGAVLGHALPADADHGAIFATLFAVGALCPAPA